jgi:hypothetical protein
MLAVRAFHPVGVAGEAVNIPRAAFLDQVADLFAVAVHQTSREVFLQRRPQLWVAVLRELSQPHPNFLSRAAQLVQRQHTVFRLGELGRELPALHLKDDTEDLDAVLLALLDEFAVVDEPIEAEARVDLAKRLPFQIRQRERAPA